MNLANLALAGLNVAENRLQTAGHNINNAATAGYSRQSVLAATAGAAATSAGYIGRGVQSVTVQRAYDGFLHRQLARAQSDDAAISSYGNEIAQVNNLLADRTVGIAPALQKFFDGIQAVASAPADSAARQELLGRAASLVSQVRDTNAFLDSQRNNINMQVTTVVAQINSHVARIRDLNQQITDARASALGHEPNDLLDQRDQLVTDLGPLTGVQATWQDGIVSLTTGNGQLLLGGDTFFPLSAGPSPSDPARVSVFYTVPAAAGATLAVELPDSRIRGGALGGLVSYRRESLDAIQDSLGRLAAGLALAVNAAHAQGADLSGDPGAEFFSLRPIAAIPDQGNSGSGGMTVQFADVNLLTAQDYSVRRDAAGFTVTRLADGVAMAIAGDVGMVDGLRFEIDGATPAGDSWLVRPTRNAAAGLSLAVADPSRIAAAAQGAGTANGDNALALARLQTGKLLGNGSLSLNEAFSQIVNKVGVQTQQNATQARAQKALVQQNLAAQQAVSGVNLNEEYISLQRHQEHYQAAARLINVSSTLFDTLLNLRS